MSGGLAAGEYRSQADSDAVWGGQAMEGGLPQSKIGRRQHMVNAYHDARHAAEMRREDVAMGYKTETTEYNRDHNMPTWGSWLKANRGSGGPQ